MLDQEVSASLETIHHLVTKQPRYLQVFEQMPQEIEDASEGLE